MGDMALIVVFASLLYAVFGLLVSQASKRSDAYLENAIFNGLGALIPLAPTAIASDTNPYTVTVDAAGRRLYVAHGDASSIVTFSIDPTSGALRPAPISRTATGAYPVSAAIDPLRMPAVLASASRPS